MSSHLRDRLIAAVGDHYLIEGELGRGGMAAVYRALDLRLNRPVAIKVLPPELAFNPSVRSRFLREAQMAAQLAHPHIVPIYSVDEVDGIVFFVMALVEGEPLGALLARRGAFELEQVRAIVSEVADALDYAHRQGVVHRDIKPDNILIDTRTARAVVTDFGIARAAAEESRLTVTGMAVGTPAYMSPEQAMGDREVDGRSDQYSLGIVAYQMLAGETPFRASNTPSMLMKHVSEPPPPLASRRPDIPRALAYAVERALGKRPEDRWSSAAAMRDAVLARHVAPDMPPLAPPPPALPASRAPYAGRPAPTPEQLPAWYHAPSRNHARAAEPEPQAPPLPQIVFSAPPPGLSRSERKQWYRQQRDAMREAFNAGVAVDSEGRDRIGAKIARFRRNIVTYAAVTFMLFVINIATSGDFPWFIFPALGMMVSLFAQMGSLWGDGVKLREIFFGPTRRMPPVGHAQASVNYVPRAPAPVAEPRPLPARAPVDAAAGLAPQDVLAGSHGAAIRRAAASRQVIGDVLDRMNVKEREPLPHDIESTVNALVDRVVSVAVTLHRLDADANGSALGTLDKRVDALRAEPASPEQERRLSLLERQRATLRDLLDRRAALLLQMESAGIALENLKLDLVRLRSAGVASALDDVTSATREARAVSREIGHMLEAQDEVRKM